ncbi:MAG: EAL domain-containing protein [Actinobacteria bacterium]|nr:MAG: EAL domain-containing protein [Actinomycetota bacterium]
MSALIEIVSFAAAQLDYILFIHGLSLLILATVSIPCRRSPSRRLPWLAFGLFGLAAGANQWLEILALQLSRPFALIALRAFVATFAFCMLLEFARGGVIRMKGRGPDAGIFVFILSAVGIPALLGGPIVMDLLSRALGVVAAAVAIVAFLMARRDRPAGVRRLLLAAAGWLALYAPTVMLSPQVTLHARAASLAGAVGLLLCLPLDFASILLAAAVWLYTGAELEDGEDVVLARLARPLGVVALVIVIGATGGWILTEGLGRYSDLRSRENLLSRTRTAAAGVNPARVSGAVAGDRPQLAFLEDQLARIRAANPDSRCVYLVSDAVEAGTIVLVHAANGDTAHATSLSLCETTRRALLSLLRTGGADVKGPLSDAAGQWMSGIAGIESDGRTIALLVMDVSTQKWQGSRGLFRLVGIVITLILSGLTISFFIAWEQTRESSAHLAALKIAEREAANERRLTNITSTLGEGVFVTDREGTITFINPEAGRLLGWDPDELLGMSVFDAVPLLSGDDTVPVPERESPLAATMEGGIGRRVEDAVFLKKDGAGVPVSYICTPLIEEGDISGSVTAFKDVTQRKRDEEDLKFRSMLLDNATDAIYVHDLDGKLIYANEAACRMRGHDREELLSRSAEGLADPEYAERVRGRVGSMLEKGSVIFESLNRHKDGSLRPMEVHARVVETAGGKVIASVARDVTERKQAEDAIRRMAYYDPLTGLPNRTLFNDRLKMALAHAHRHREMVGVMFLDLDRFKTINDTLGHEVGDRLLKGVAERLRRLVREGDTVARLGGDEFTLLLPQVGSEEDAAKIAFKVLEAMKEPFRTNGHEMHATASVGVALYPDHGQDAESLLKNADIAMYQAKEEGRDNWKLYSLSMKETTLYRLAMETKLRPALERDEFILHYQPQVCVRTGEVVGIEALVRWIHPERGIVGPSEFIPVAEDTGLIVPISDWVLRTACLQARKWQELGYSPVRMAVNVSARQFRQSDLVDKVADVLEETGLEPCFLELEITESIAMQDVEMTIDTLQALRGMGIRIAIDDFGTGYSSLNSLKRFPIHTLKIAQTFVRDVTTNAESAAIATTVLVLAQNLGLTAIAEGVETEQQLEFLKRRDCTQMQGYLFSLPVTADRIPPLLKMDSVVGV